jgi:hypothetical protein
VTAEEDGRSLNAERAPADEQFTLTVASADVIEADANLWAKLELYLGADPVGAWVLREVTHGEILDPETGQPTGQIASTATFQRDPEVPSPIVAPRAVGVEQPAAEE